MEALVWHGGADLRLERIADAPAGEGEVVFDVRLAGICGSDLHPYRGHHGPRRPPLVLGHEAVGTVVGLPGRYALFPLVSCGACASCLRHESQLCERRGLVGLDRQGVFAERVRVRSDALVPVPDGLDDRLAALAEPLATAVSTLRLEGVGRDTRLLVLGAGPIGLLVVYAAVAAGAVVSIVEPLPRRRALARRLGADDRAAQGYDVAVDAVGIEQTWTAAVASVRSGGSVAVVGLGQAEGGIPMGDLVRRGITVRGHYAYSRADFERALALLADDPPPSDWLSVHTLRDGAEGFRRLVETPDDTIKVLLEVANGE